MRTPKIEPTIAPAMASLLIELDELSMLAAAAPPSLEPYHEEGGEVTGELSEMLEKLSKEMVEELSEGVEMQEAFLDEPITCTGTEELSSAVDELGLAELSMELSTETDEPPAELSEELSAFALSKDDVDSSPSCLVLSQCLKLLMIFDHVIILYRARHMF